MMNLYREEEKAPRRTLKQVIKDGIDSAKLALSTGSSRRNKMIKTIAKEIKSLDASDAETMQKIHRLVVSYELCSDMYGKTIEEADMKAYLQKLQENGTLKEIEESIKNEMKCYDFDRTQQKQIGEEN